MNVAFDRWIPVVTTSGKPEKASLAEVFTQGDTFADLAVRPHERVALMRLFLCIAHAALEGPRNYPEWYDVPKQLAEKVYKYLTKWNREETFELFHPNKPWLQVAALKGVEKGNGNAGQTSPVALLDFELATGNRTTLFDHSGSMRVRMIDPGRIALNLLTFQNFSSGGGSPVAQWGNTKTKQVGNPDAPCLSQSMAHCLLRGRNLKETIHLNLPTFEHIRMLYHGYSYNKKEKKDLFTEVDLGRPVWECFPSTPEDSEAIINATRTYMGRLVPISRWVRLIENTDQMYCCNGFKYDTYRDGFPAEPTSAVRLIRRRDKKGIETEERKIVGISPGKAIWRELSALMTKRTAEGIGGPLAMNNAPKGMAYDFHVCAMTRDQASMDIAIDSVFHIRTALQDNLGAYSDEVTRSERIYYRLRRAVGTYRSTIDNDWVPRVKRSPPRDKSKLKDRLAQTASLFYWTTVEKNLPLLMDHIEAIGTDNAISTRAAWRKMVFAAACDAYRTACGQESPRQRHAFAKGWQVLTSKGEELEQEMNDNDDEEEV